MIKIVPSSRNTDRRSDRRSSKITSTTNEVFDGMTELYGHAISSLEVSVLMARRRKQASASGAHGDAGRRILCSRRIKRFDNL